MQKMKIFFHRILLSLIKSKKQLTHIEKNASPGGKFATKLFYLFFFLLHQTMEIYMDQYKEDFMRKRKSHF